MVRGFQYVWRVCMVWPRNVRDIRLFWCVRDWTVWSIGMGRRNLLQRNLWMEWPRRNSRRVRDVIVERYIWAQRGFRVVWMERCERGVWRKLVKRREWVQRNVWSQWRERMVGSVRERTVRMERGIGRVWIQRNTRMER
jgi:hypothetical protein